MEIWKPSKKYSNYEISNEGRVRNAKTGRVLKTQLDDKGYAQVVLQKDGRQYRERVHKLIADTFIGTTQSNMDVIHRDNNRLNNHVSNLEYMSRADSVRLAFKRGKHAPNQTAVRVVETGEIFPSISECSRALGVSVSGISKCINGAAYSTCGLHFERVD